MNNHSNIASYCNFSAIIIYSIVALIPIQMVLFIMFPHPNTIIEWFSLYKDTPIIGFIGFDIVYIFSNVLMIFLYLSLFIIIKKNMNNLTIFAFILAFISLTIYFSSNRFIEMYTISNKYFEATNEIQKYSLIAAGELLLSVYKGSSYFIYYILSGLSLILLFKSFSKIEYFSKRTVKMGILSGFFMLVPATMGIIGMVFSLLSLIPWIITCVFLVGDIKKIKNLTIAST